MRPQRETRTGLTESVHDIIKTRVHAKNPRFPPKDGSHPWSHVCVQRSVIGPSGGRTISPSERFLRRHAWHAQQQRRQSGRAATQTRV